MLNPLTHAGTPAGVATYKVEPYVVAADVYTAAGQLGRGGWTWYTGSASWMYRVALETLLGFTKRGDTLSFAPCLPSGWQGYDIAYRYGGAEYRITVALIDVAQGAEPAVVLDGRRLAVPVIPLVDDGVVHVVHVAVGRTVAGRAAAPFGCEAT
jgi:cyclic beta-1,2-glucan synthetase